MEKHPAKSIDWWRAATAILLAVLIIPSSSCGLHPSAGHSSDGLSHQPFTFGQMEALVTPNDPLVKQALYDALNPPPPEPTVFTMNGVTYTNPAPADTRSDFELIKSWLAANCVYTSDMETHGVSDYWQSATETITLGKGDCEDYSILLCSLLRAYGVPADQVYVVVGYTSAGEAHSWLLEHYCTDIWRLHDSLPTTDSQGLVVDSASASGYSASYCFNDKDAFYGNPVLPAGVYEFESASTSYPTANGASDSYYRYLNAGQKITATVEWLAYSVEWPFNPLVLEPWSLNLYTENGEKVFTWSGTDNRKTLEFTVEHTGIYRLEIVKRDNPARPCRLSIDPREGWNPDKPLRIDLLRVEQPPFPKAGGSQVIETPPDTTPSVWQDETPRVPAPVEVPRDGLVQHALDTINAKRASNGLPPITLGSNSAAQQHADDMLVHDFVSGWGTDGSTPEERYTLTGGIGVGSESECMIEINWQGGPALFANALQAAIEQAVKNLKLFGQVTQYAVYTGSGIITIGNINPEQFKLQPDRVNIGLAYDGEHLFMVVQYESFYMTYSQLPTIQNGKLSFAGQCAPDMSLWSIYISYSRTPSPLTAAQISYASFLDPHWVPLDLPPSAVTGFDLTGLLNGLNMNSESIEFHGVTGSEVQENEFVFSMNLSELVGNFGKGVYTITITGKSPAGMSYYIPQLSTYTIFVN